MTVIGDKSVIRKFSDLPDKIRQKVALANKRSGDELVKTAKVLIPVGSDVHGDGHERNKITGTSNPETGDYLADFGPKSKVIEGRRGPRPFVNPALSVTRKRHAARARRATKQAVKELFGDG